MVLVRCWRSQVREVLVPDAYASHSLLLVLLLLLLLVVLLLVLLLMLLMLLLLLLLLLMLLMLLLLMLLLLIVLLLLVIMLLLLMPLLLLLHLQPTSPRTLLIARMLRTIRKVPGQRPQRLPVAHPPKDHPRRQHRDTIRRRRRRQRLLRDMRQRRLGEVRRLLPLRENHAPTGAGRIPTTDISLRMARRRRRRLDRRLAINNRVRVRRRGADLSHRRIQPRL